ncbi:MAG: hypothetical protein PHV53_11640, partial [Fermentimonas sp.]|nr:hypothetical protein [Fermentimonas sp.]
MAKEKLFLKKNESGVRTEKMNPFILLYFIFFMITGTIHIQAQNRVSLSLNNVTLEQAISTIENQ